MYTLETEQWFPRPVGEVFAFFADAGNLDRITPPWLRFEILTPLPVAMQPGLLLDYRLRYRSWPLRWRTRIDEWDPPVQFIDTQLRGPYRRWHHTHRFESVAGGTRVIDIVQYALPLGPLGRMVHALSVRRDVAAIFEYRRTQLDELFATRT